MIVAGVAVAAFVFQTDEPPALKLLALGGLGVSMALPCISSTHILGMVSLLLQVALCLWLLIYFKLKH